MITNETIPTPEVTNILTEIKRVELKAKVLLLWDNFDTREELARDMEQWYIFWKYSNNEHFSIDDIMAIINEVYLEKNPVVVEPVLETNV